MDKSEIAVKYASKFLNVGKPDYLGSGAYASAYMAGDKVIKVTDDLHDSVICSKLIGKTFKHIVNVEGVFKFNHEDLASTRYIILSEPLRTLNPKNGRLDDILIDYFPYIRYALQNNFNTKSKLKEALQKEFEYYLGGDFDQDLGSISESEISYLIGINGQLLGMMAELATLRMKNLDIHAYNVGFSGEVLKILDLGYYSSTGNVKNIREVEL